MCISDKIDISKYSDTPLQKILFRKLLCRMWQSALCRYGHIKMRMKKCILFQEKQKRKKTDGKRILCKLALNGVTPKNKKNSIKCAIATYKHCKQNLRRTNNANKFREVSLKKVQVIKLDPPKISRNRRACFGEVERTQARIDKRQSNITLHNKLNCNVECNDVYAFCCWKALFSCLFMVLHLSIWNDLIL